MTNDINVGSTMGLRAATAFPVNDKQLQPVILQLGSDVQISKAMDFFNDAYSCEMNIAKYHDILVINLHRYKGRSGLVVACLQCARSWD